MKPRGGPPLWLMNSRGGPHFLGCMLMNSRGRSPILRGGPPLGTISMDQTVPMKLGHSEKLYVNIQGYDV